LTSRREPRLRHQLDLLEATRRRRAHGVTIVAVLHDLTWPRCSPRIVVLDRGRVVADGTPAEVITDEMLEQVFGSPARSDRVPRPACRSCCRTRWPV